DRAVDARRLHAALRLMQLDASQILRCRRVRRAANEGRKCSDVANVVVARLLAEAPHAHVLDHARAQRAVGRCTGWEVIRGSSLELKVAGPSMLGTGYPDRHAFLFKRSSSLPTTHDRDACPPARAGSFPGAEQKLTVGDGCFRFCA